MDLYIKDGKKYKLVASVGRRTHTVHQPDADGDEEYNRLHTAIIPDAFISDAMTLPPGLWLSTQSQHSKGISTITCVSEIPSNPYDYTAIIKDRDDLATFITQFLEKNSKPGSKPGWVMMPSNSELALGICKWLTERAGVKMIKPGEPKERRLDPDL